MAQNSPFRISRQVYSLLWYLNKTNVGLIYNRVLPYANLVGFSQADTSSAPHFGQAAYELYALGLASVYPGPSTQEPNNPTSPDATPPSPPSPSPALPLAPAPVQLEQRKQSCAGSGSSSQTIHILNHK